MDALSQGDVVFSCLPHCPHHTLLTQVTIQETDFVKNGGDIKWLQGLHHVPQKILNLLVVNKTVAHQPWLLKPDHMKVRSVHKNRLVFIFVFNTLTRNTVHLLHITCMHTHVHTHTQHTHTCITHCVHIRHFCEAPTVGQLRS